MALTVAFRGVPGDDAPVARPLIDLRLAELPELPVTCLLDTGSIGKPARPLGRGGGGARPLRRGAPAPLPRRIDGRGRRHRRAAPARRARSHTWTAPVSFCDPWPAPFGLLGQEGFLRHFVAELRTAERLVRLTPVTG